MAPSATGSSSLPFRRSQDPKSLATSLSKCKIQGYVDTGVPQNVVRQVPIGTSGLMKYVGSSSIRSLAWSPLGNHIATGDSHVLRVWNPERHEIRYSTELKLPVSATVGGHSSSRSRTAAASGFPGRVYGTERVAWNPAKEAELASLGSDGTVRFWDVRAKTPMVGEVKVGDGGYSLAWRQSSGKDAEQGGEICVVTKGDTIVRLSIANLAEITSQRQGTQTNQIRFTHSGNELLLPTGDGQIKMVDYPSLNHVFSWNAHTSACNVVTLDPHARIMATGGSDSFINIWDTQHYYCKYTLTDTQGPVRSLDFSFDGAYLVAGAEETGGIKVYNVESGEAIYTVPTSTAPGAAANPSSNPAALNVQWHPSRYLLAYASAADGSSQSSDGLKVAGLGSSGL